ncbi:MAG: hypothetical protein H7A23_03685 [Leptospiraceae bacterium]|nr:hypothetical protein [Leptospiraceae bacterium]MCP5493632.1 hypothetical protein [Leptospiraceae bacterium]
MVDTIQSYKEWTLAKLDKTFGLHQVRTSTALDSWLDGEADITDFETQTLNRFLEKLCIGVYDWNETELAYNFIGPILALVDYTSERFNFFAERSFSGKVDGIEMGGRPDGMIASGFREPEKPFFCFHEYKKEKDPEGDPAGQTLAAMLVAQEINQHQFPLYGCYVKGEVWHFMILQDRNYCISNGFLATRQTDLYNIFRILRVLKTIITKILE